MTARTLDVSQPRAVRILCTTPKFGLIYDSIREAAQELGCSVGTMEKRISDGRPLEGTPFGSIKVKRA